MFNKRIIQIRIDQKIKNILCNWRPPSLSELTPMMFDEELTHLSSEASKNLSLAIGIVGSLGVIKSDKFIMPKKHQ